MPLNQQKQFQHVSFPFIIFLPTMKPTQTDLLQFKVQSPCILYLSTSLFGGLFSTWFPHMVLLFKSLSTVWMAASL
jgi:hypothetical protein